MILNTVNLLSCIHRVVTFFNFIYIYPFARLFPHFRPCRWFPSNSHTYHCASPSTLDMQFIQTWHCILCINRGYYDRRNRKKNRVFKTRFLFSIVFQWQNTMQGIMLHSYWFLKRRGEWEEKGGRRRARSLMIYLMKASFSFLYLGDPIQIYVFIHIY